MAELAYVVERTWFPAFVNMLSQVPDIRLLGGLFFYNEHSWSASTSLSDRRMISPFPPMNRFHVSSRIPNSLEGRVAHAATPSVLRSSS